MLLITVPCATCNMTVEMFHCIAQAGAVDVFLDFISYSGGPLAEDLLEVIQQPVSILWGMLHQETSAAHRAVSLYRLSSLPSAITSCKAVPACIASTPVEHS